MTGAAAPAAERGDDVYAVQVGQSEVEDHRVGRLARGRGQGSGAVRRGVDLVSPRGQRDGERAGQGRVVVDDQDPGHRLRT